MRGNKWMRFSVLSSLRQSTHFNWLIHSWSCNPRKTAAGRRSRMWGDDCTCSAHLQKGHVDEISSDTFTQNASKHQVPLGVLNFVWWCHMITARGLEWLFCDSSTLPLAVTFWVVSALKAPTNTWDQLRQQAGNCWPLPKPVFRSSIYSGGSSGSQDSPEAYNIIYTANAINAHVDHCYMGSFPMEMCQQYGTAPSWPNSKEQKWLLQWCLQWHIKSTLTQIYERS